MYVVRFVFLVLVFFVFLCEFTSLQKHHLFDICAEISSVNSRKNTQEAKKKEDH